MDLSAEIHALSCIKTVGCTLGNTDQMIAGGCISGPVCAADPDTLQGFLAVIGQPQICNDDLLGSIQAMVAQTGKIKHFPVRRREYKRKTACRSRAGINGFACDAQCAPDKTFNLVRFVFHDAVIEADIAIGLKGFSLVRFIPAQQGIGRRMESVVEEISLQAQGHIAEAADDHMGNILVVTAFPNQLNACAYKDDIGNLFFRGRQKIAVVHGRGDGIADRYAAVCGDGDRPVQLAVCDFLRRCMNPVIDGDHAVAGDDLRARDLQLIIGMV